SSATSREGGEPERTRGRIRSDGQGASGGRCRDSNCPPSPQSKPDRRSRLAAAANLDPLGKRICGGRWPHGLWAGLALHVSERRRADRKNTQGRETGGSAN